MGGRLQYTKVVCPVCGKIMNLNSNNIRQHARDKHEINIKNKGFIEVLEELYSMNPKADWKRTAERWANSLG